MERFLANIVVEEKTMSITYSVCVCSLGYPALDDCAPYCHLWPVRLCSIFPLYVKKA